MIVNSMYMGFDDGGGGGETQTGYSEEKMLYYYDGISKNMFYFRGSILSPHSDKTYYARPNSSTGATIEAYIQMDGASRSAYSRGFSLGSNAFCIAFGNGGGSSGSDYRYNPMIYWGANIDYDIFPSGLIYGDKHSFAIVSAPDLAETDPNTLRFYIDGVQVGEEKSQNRNVEWSEGYLTVEGSTNRPLNGTVFNGRFYTRALSVDELLANHQNDITKYGGNS